MTTAAGSATHTAQGSERTRFGPLAPLLAGAVAILFFVSNIVVSAGASRDYDEGVYWQTLRSLVDGHQLFRDVFAPQGPVFFYSLLPIYIALGHSIAAARIGIALFSLLAAAGIFIAAWAVAGRWAGLVAVLVLMTDPLWAGEARTLHAEVPSLALALVALGLGTVAARPAIKPQQAQWLALSSGAMLALGTATKAFVILFAAAIVTQLLVARGRGAWRLMAFGVLGFVLLGVIVFLPYVGSLRAVWDDLVTVHLSAGRVMNSGIRTNLSLLHLSRELVVLEGAAMLFAILGVIRRDREIIAPLVWLLLTSIALLLYHPLFAHEVTLLIAPLAFIVAVGLLRQWKAVEGDPSRDLLSVAGVTIVLLIVAVAAVRDVPAFQTAAGPSVHEQQLANAVVSHTQSGELVIGDNPYAIALANRDTPPPLVDTSFARVLSQALTAESIEKVAVADQVPLFVFDTGRLDGVAGLRAWVAANYPTVVTLPKGGTLYTNR